VYALRGVKEERAGGDDAIRPAFPAAGPSALPGADPAVFRLHQRLIGLRRRHPWLRQTPSTTEQLRNDQYVIKQQHGPHVLRLALNLADQPLAVPPECRVLIADPATESDPSRVAPQGWAVLEPTRD
jgi:cyclomaltodextrinase